MADNIFTKTFKRVFNREKAIVNTNNNEIIISPTSTPYFFGHSNNDPLLENVYNVIAHQSAQHKMNLYNKKNNKNRLYEASESPIARMFDTRINPLSTPKDFLHSFFYNTVKYGNGIAFIQQYDKNGDVILPESGVTGLLKETVKIQLIPLDTSKCEFGKIYIEEFDVTYLIIRHLSGKDVTYEARKLDYSTIIHLRYKPQNYFYGESYSNDPLSEIRPVFNTAIKKKLRDMISENGDKVVFKLSNVAQADNQTKGVKSRQIQESLTGGKVITIDADEDLKKLELTKFAYDKEAIDDIKELIYNSYGINKSILEGKYNESEYNSFYNNTIEPLVGRFQEEITTKLLSEEQIINGDIIKLIRPRTLGFGPDMIKQIQQLIYQGINNANEIREQLGYDPIDGGDQYFTNANAVALNDALQTDNKDNTQNTDNEKMLKGGEENETI